MVSRQQHEAAVDPARHASTSDTRSPSNESRPSREGAAQRAAQEVAGLKNYQLGDCLGKGAFGSVYRALNWGTGETVAIKQVRLENLGTAELKTIMLEIDLLKSLSHPNIVRYVGSAKGSESLYIILEYCENGSLHSICKNFGKFPENLVALYMSQILHGLLYLHEQGVIHRDIKGANILTTKEGLVKLADFGVATKQSGLDQSSVVGTPYWMAPEVIELSGATTASDIWSVGCTVIELIEGRPPYHKLQPMQALFRIVNDDHPPLPGSASKLLNDFLMECFQKNPNLRIDAKRLLRHPWILSAKRTVPTIPTKPTEYKEAVKSVQEWNEALKKPNSHGRSSRLASAAHKTALSQSPDALKSSRKSALVLDAKPAKQRPNTDAFRSPGMESIWDDDFVESHSDRALQQDHFKTQDLFSGQLSQNKLKEIVALNTVIHDASDTDGDATVKSPLNLQQIRELTGLGNHVSKRDHNRIRASVSSKGMSGSKIGATSSAANTSTVLLRGSPTPTISQGGQSAPAARPSQLFRETSVEDYSDLMPADESAFEKRVKAMQNAKPPSMLPRNPVITQTPRFSTDPKSPNSFHPRDSKKLPPAVTSGAKTVGPRKRAVSSSANRKMQRSQSDIAIQKYAEEEGDDFSDLAGEIRSARADSDEGSELGSLTLLASKMSSSFMITDDDDLDPFANMDEGIENLNLENNVARDRDDRLVKQTESLVGCLKSSQPHDVLLTIAEQLLQVLYESPDKRMIVLRSHGMLPMLEILGSKDDPIPNEVVLLLLRSMNLIIQGDAESQESLSFLGGIPIICNYATKKYPSKIRQEAAAFVRQMYQTSTLTLQMFIGCGGIDVLVEFLEEDMDEERDLVLIGVNGVWNVFELPGSTPKNDFCRKFSKSSVLYPLSLVLSRVVDERDEVARLLQGRIVSIFLIFSQAESHVKEMVADRMILKRVLKDLRKMMPEHQVTMLKFIKNLSMLSSTHETLQNSNAIDTLIELLKNSRHQSNSREISNQVLNTMYNLCRHNKSRQEEAALSDIIPLLKDVVKSGGHLKEFALPILCELAHSGKVARKMLWDAKGLQFYTSMLADRNWQVTALDAIFVWLQEETARVEQYLLSSNFGTAIVSSYTSPELSQSTFESMLEPLQKLVRLSPPIAASLAVPEIFTRTIQKLGHRDAVTRLNLLRILRTICDATDDECTLIKKFGVYDTILHLSHHDSAILVRQMAEELIRTCDEVAKRSVSRATGFRRPASSSGTRAGSGSSSGSNITSAFTPPTPKSLQSTFVVPPLPNTPSSTNAYPRDRMTRSQSTVGIWNLEEEPTHQKPASLVRSSTSLASLGGTNNYMSSPAESARILASSRDQASMTLASNEPNKDSVSKSSSRLPKARPGRLSEAVYRRRHSQVSNGEENQTPGSNPLSSAENVSQPLPRLQITRRRRESHKRQDDR